MTIAFVDIKNLDMQGIHYKELIEERDFDVLKKTMEAWDSNITRRYKRSQTNVSINKIHKQQDYDIMNWCTVAMQKITSLFLSEAGKAYGHNIRFLLKGDITQSMCCYKYMNADDMGFSSNSVYVSYLLSAPWNIKMHALIGEYEEHLVTKGSGATMLLTIIKTAYFKQCEHLFLFPLSVSCGFYDKLGMSCVENKEMYFLDLRLKISSIFVDYKHSYEKGSPDNNRELQHTPRKSILISN